MTAEAYNIIEVEHHEVRRDHNYYYGTRDVLHTWHFVRKN